VTDTALAGLVTPCVVCGRNVLRAAAIFWTREGRTVYGCAEHRDEVRLEMRGLANV
jgi:hypothetical protein